MTRSLTQWFRGFARETRGDITTEAIIVLPVLLWLFGVGWVYFDVFRQQSVNQKANYAISDMLSRQTDRIEAPFVDSTFSLFNVLTRSGATGGGLRLTMVSYDQDTDSWTEEWSHVRGNAGTGDLSDFSDRLPTVHDGDHLIVVESWDHYAPVFKVGLDAFDITTFSFTRPRYTPQVAGGRSESAGEIVTCEQRVQDYASANTLTSDEVAAMLWSECGTDNS
ncbi:TadE/TadG family type IV pilus assembly protein [Thetidibacter halocola]|uniref:Pilus assembly protein n=1 Tax=Thetidibacter halocola TaxID=2827239 RepID=A0A8J7WH99_9RHOB|nr:hypothetical protein [Thetidibacter halocola]MBS0125306.1 hypothetical protein [Thetidibacter halocola]